VKLGQRPSSSVLVFAILWLAMAVTFVICRARTGGTFVYPLDDSYIYLALAKNIAEHGVYGVTQYEFTPASSSIVWPLLLLAVRAITKNELGPLLLNVVFASVLARVLDVLLAEEGYGPKVRVAVVLGILFALPIFPIVFVGMEHTLHVLSVLLLVHAAVRVLAAAPSEATSGAVLGRVALLAMLSTGARYESLFVVGTLGLLALCRRRLSLAFALGIGGSIPVVAYATFSLARGGPVFPISVLIKRNDLHAWSFLPTMGSRLVGNPHLLALLVLLSFFYFAGTSDVEGRPGAFWERRRLMLLVAGAVIVLHVVFAQMGWLYRYEAYAMALGLVALAGPLHAYRARLGLVVPLALAMVPVVMRGAHAVRAVPAASGNIYEQQMQMARFVSQYYGGGSVVLNDIGAVTYLADVHIVDIHGLGSPSVANLLLRGGFDRDATERLTREASIAIVDASYSAPPQWRQIGLWQTPDNIVCGDDRVSLYAIHPQDEAYLTASLREFSSRLPVGMGQSGPYTR